MKIRTTRILLADDHPALRSALALLLETRLHAQVVGEAYRMEDLLEGAAQLHPDLVILDWELPGLPLEGRLPALRRVDPDVKIVVTNSRPELEEQARRAQADAYFSKYEPPERMLKILQTLASVREKSVAET